MPGIRQSVHITGRSIDSKEPKYLHLPCEIKYLYNKEALSSDKVIVSEGIKDCISCE